MEGFKKIIAGAAALFASGQTAAQEAPRTPDTSPVAIDGGVSFEDPVAEIEQGRFTTPFTTTNEPEIALTRPAEGSGGIRDLSEDDLSIPPENIDIPFTEGRLPIHPGSRVGIIEGSHGEDLLGVTVKVTR